MAAAPVFHVQVPLLTDGSADGASCTGGLRYGGEVDPEEQRGERESELDLGAHQAVPQVQATHREEPGLHAHDMQPVPLRVLLAVPGRLEGAWRAHRRLLRLQQVSLCST